MYGGADYLEDQLQQRDPGHPAGRLHVQALRPGGGDGGRHRPGHAVAGQLPDGGRRIRGQQLRRQLLRRPGHACSRARSSRSTPCTCRWRTRRAWTRSRRPPCVPGSRRTPRVEPRGAEPDLRPGDCLDAHRSTSRRPTRPSPPAGSVPPRRRSGRCPADRRPRALRAHGRPPAGVRQEHRRRRQLRAAERRDQRDGGPGPGPGQARRGQDRARPTSTGRHGSPGTSRNWLPRSASARTDRTATSVSLSGIGRACRSSSAAASRRGCGRPS